MNYYSESVEFGGIDVVTVGNFKLNLTNKYVRNRRGEYYYCYLNVRGFKAVYNRTAEQKTRLQIRTYIGMKNKRLNVRGFRWRRNLPIGGM